MNRTQLKLVGLILILSVMLNSCDNSGEEIDPCLNGPVLNVDNIISSDEGMENGEITVSTAGGSTPFQYSIDGMTFQSSGTFSGLEPDDYTITVKDANDCTNTTMATVEELVIVFYATQIRPIIDGNCQFSPCHGSNASIPSWATYDDVKAKANSIKNKTSDKTMPPNGVLSDSDIKLIADWVDQGALDN